MEGQSSVNWNSVPHSFGNGFVVSSNGQAPPRSYCDENLSYAMGGHFDGNNEIEQEKKESPWHRVKWIDQMVKLLITIVSYIGEDAASDCSGGRRRVSPTLPKKGKWKAISKVMAERGFHVSPQQCEDKFNDLNRRYKKLNDILGRGTSCDVVENPAQLDLMDIPDEAKESVRKTLSSKQLFYREMCSYHNGNRLYLPHDQSVQRSLQSALRSNDDLEFHEAKPYRFIDDDSSDSENDNTEGNYSKDLGSKSVLAKRKKPEDNVFMDLGYILKIPSTTNAYTPRDHASMNEVSLLSVDEELQMNHQIMWRSLQLEEKKLHIQAEMLELKEERLRWLKYRELKDGEMEKMRLANRYLKIENLCLALDIKRRETARYAN